MTSKDIYFIPEGVNRIIKPYRDFYYIKIISDNMYAELPIDERDNYIWIGTNSGKKCIYIDAKTGQLTIRI